MSTSLTWESVQCKCGHECFIGIMSLAVTCECGRYYAAIGGEHGGWYSSRDSYTRGDAPEPKP
jgi:hypothetical protein